MRMRHYTITEGQLIALWIFGAALWSRVSGILFSILGLLGLFLSFLIFPALFYYSKKWRDYRKYSTADSNIDKLDSQPKKIVTIFIGLLGLAIVAPLSGFLEEILGDFGAFLLFLIFATLIFYIMWGKLGHRNN